MTATMPDQITLPLRIAFEVVLQGLRIRLGRALVTLSGVICGIAFLMLTLTGQLIKQGVATEAACRREVSRIASFMRADLPNLRGKPMGIVGGGILSEVEIRVLEQLRREGAGALLLPAGWSPKLPRPVAGARPVAPAQLADLTAIVLVMGDGPVPAFDGRGFLDHTRNAMIASTRPPAALAAAGADARWVRLAREPLPGELARQTLAARQARCRGRWVVSIALLVTVIGIANAMLMSVTERFREIGTMKCLGALSGFITRIFVLEASLLGLVGGLAGALVGVFFAVTGYACTYGAGLVLGSLPLVPILGLGAASVLAGIGLSIVAAIYPARVAASMVPAAALRSTV